MAVSEETMAKYDVMATKNNEFVYAIEALPIPRKEVRKLLRMYVDAKTAAEEFQHSLRTDVQWVVLYKN